MIVGCCIVILTVIGKPLKAQAQEQEVDEPWELTLQQLAEMVLDKNSRLISQRYDQKITYWGLQREKSIFEPNLVVSGTHDENEQRRNIEEQQSFLLSNTRVREFNIYNNNRYNAGIEGLLPLGTRYALETSLRDLDNNSNSFKNEYATVTTFRVVQPLLKNAGVSVTKAGINIATVQTRISYQELRRQVLSMLLQGERLYWQLVAAQEEYNLRNESLAIADKIVVDNRARVKSGKMSELEIEQALTGRDTRLRLRDEASQRLITARNQIHTLIAHAITDGKFDFIAVEKPQLATEPLDFDAVMTQAVSENPDYAINRETIEQESIRLAYAQNQRWPQLDLTTSYGLNGLADSIDRSYGDIRESEFETWSVGLELRIPLGGGKRSKSELQAARLRKQKALNELKAVETEIVNTVDTILQRLKFIVNQMATYDRELAFNEKLLSTEITKLAEGKSDSRRVLEFEEDVFEIRLERINSLVSYQLAMLDLEFINSTLLAKRNINIDATLTE